MSLSPEYTNDFRAVSYPVRLYSGKDALENLPAELKRSGAKRAFIVCGRTVSRKTDLIAHMRRILGENCSGVFDEMDKDTTLSSVTRAAEAASAAQADMLIGVGSGSVTQGTRVVAILMAEKRPVDELITQYPENAPAISPRLLESKVPIINVLTSATSAQNRAGSAVKDSNRNHRMEFFDPKTRPVAVFWDAEALMTAPMSLVRTTTISAVWRTTMNLGALRVAPLAEGDRLQAFRLARYALEHLNDSSDVSPRIAACAAAFLQNRDADDGGMAAGKHWVERVVYAFATALFQMHVHVGQGEASAALTPTVMRKLGSRNPQSMALIAQGLGVWRDGEPIDGAPEKAAAELERLFKNAGMPVCVSALNIPRESLPLIVDNSLRNFNADPKREFVRERDMLLALIEACW
ncbi:MAG TPA: iron-containing alcohol dehydrogenase family protein [Burkholderiales bacterium]|nr:iron-containing alcohol dehydrogenase family protein [Burkholderiales bacterium]